ncbi:hypothetical protein AMS69_13580 [Haloarcula rubripromontorii]|uniref:Uncharacterized protein n=1 Tax=Haloarcula rubripromontorii TaxID=1705562 RepID=A0A0M9AI00_9EURY|nr:hypothetical protein [Haloarcula rubripromontorii]KOX92399.1 hypothetical protein AMS69_13580 [Haloarcula rubripromontorii]
MRPSVVEPPDAVEELYRPRRFDLFFQNRIEYCVYVISTGLPVIPYQGRVGMCRPDLAGKSARCRDSALATDDDVVELAVVQQRLRPVGVRRRYEFDCLAFGGDVGLQVKQQLVVVDVEDSRGLRGGPRGVVRFVYNVCCKYSSRSISAPIYQIYNCLSSQKPARR